jgi:hypothetical protein
VVHLERGKGSRQNAVRPAPIPVTWMLSWINVAALDFFVERFFVPGRFSQCKCTDYAWIYLRVL